MRTRAIILTGTSGSGKTEVQRRLLEDPRFVKLRAITTRPPRTSDEPGDYQHLSDSEFQSARAQGLLTDTRYREHSYGYRQSDFNAALAEGKIPVLVLTPESAEKLTIGDPHARRYLPFFVDAPDDVLDSRLARRDGQLDEFTVHKQRRADRYFKEKLLFSLENVDLDATVRLILWRIEFMNVGGVLPSHAIRDLLATGNLLLDYEPAQVKGASYDLRLGDEYFYKGEMRRLSDDMPLLTIDPYDCAIVTSRETAAMPLDVSARYDLRVSLFCQGVVMSAGPQVDPGFRGPLFCLLLNTSSQPVQLKRGDKYVTVEFHRLVEPTEPYKGRYTGGKLLDYLPVSATHGAINRLKEQLEETRNQSNKLQEVILALVSLLLAVTTLVIGLKGL